MHNKSLGKTYKRKAACYEFPKGESTREKLLRKKCIVWEKLSSKDFMRKVACGKQHEKNGLEKNAQQNGKNCMRKVACGKSTLGTFVKEVLGKV